MKLLMFHAEVFEYSASVQTLADAPALETAEDRVSQAVVVFMHAEPRDAERGAKLITKCAKNVKWLANKAGLKRVVLHSFDHLGEEKATPEDAHRLIEALVLRLRSNGYEVSSTPFGYSSRWSLSVPGAPIAKVFKAL